MVQVYRSYQLLVNRFNAWLNIIAMQGQKFLNLCITTMGVYGTLRYYHSLNILAYLTFPSVTMACILFANVAYPYGRILNSDTLALRRSWMRVKKSELDSATEVGPSKYMTKVLQSCRDLKIKMGNFYFYEDTTSTTYNSIVIDNATYLLLSF